MGCVCGAVLFPPGNKCTPKVGIRASSKLPSAHLYVCVPTLLSSEVCLEPRTRRLFFPIRNQTTDDINQPASSLKPRDNGQKGTPSSRNHIKKSISEGIFAYLVSSCSSLPYRWGSSVTASSTESHAGFPGFASPSRTSVLDALGRTLLHGRNWGGARHVYMLVRLHCHRRHLAWPPETALLPPRMGPRWPGIMERETRCAEPSFPRPLSAPAHSTRDRHSAACSPWQQLPPGGIFFYAATSPHLSSQTFLDVAPSPCEPIMSPRPSLRNFLSLARGRLAAFPAQLGSPLTFVVGNESAGKCHPS